MSYRLQVILHPKEYSLIKREATAQSKSISAWVRDLIRRGLALRREQKGADPIATFKQLHLPSPPINQMLKEIDLGRD